jgi:flagellar basal body-associated protein FliL
VKQTSSDPLVATETWFVQNGLPYFVPEERAAARAALRPRRAVPLLVLVALVAAALGGLLGWVSDQFSAAPALWLTLAVLAGIVYASTALRARPILSWAVGRTFSSLRLLLSTASRALPLLLVFVTFLFINAEAWQMTSRLPFGRLWVVALLLMGLGIVFLLVRLPSEVDAVDDAVDDAFLTRACARTPLEESCRELIEDPEEDAAAHAQVTGFARWNLILVLLIIQFVQVLVLVVAVFAFFLMFGSLVTTEAVQVAWTGLACECTHHIPYLDSVSAELVKVSLFLAAFSGLYFTVSAVTDETYREQFFSTVMREMERAVGVRAVYLALRARTSHRP